MKIKECPEDFVVKEILNISLKRKGNYKVYLLKKVGITTFSALQELSNYLKIPKNCISYCGLKDKNCISYQYISFPSNIKIPNIIKKEKWEIKFQGFLNTSLNSHFIKYNNFSIKVKNPLSFDKSRIEILNSLGIPNYYGEQRFISVRNNEFFIEKYLKKDYKEAINYLFTPHRRENSKDRKMKKLFQKGELSKAYKLANGFYKKIIKVLIDSQDYKKAYSFIPSDEIKFQMHVLESYLFNEKINSFILSQTKNYLKYKYKLGYFYFPLEKINIPPSIYCNFSPSYLEEKEIYINNSNIFKGFKRDTWLFPLNLNYIKSNNYISFHLSLPSGAYATLILNFIFKAIENR